MVVRFGVRPSIILAMRLASLLVLVAAAITPVAAWRAQSPGRQASTFDVVSIKPNRTLDPNTAVAQVRILRNRVLAPSATLRDLVRAAYNYQFRPVSMIVGGPRWVDTDRYEVIGQASALFGPAPGRGLLPEAANEMLRAMLADRFQLRMHFEMRERNVYELVIDREDGQLGPTLTPAKGDCQSSMATPDPKMINVPPCPFFLRWDADGTTTYEMRNITVPELASTIGNYPSIDELVVDRTGLTGRFDIKVTSFEPRPQGTSPAARELPPPTDIALRQQLGLRLRRARLPVEVIVIDSVSRPSEN
jgi:uncharacterized protein (TIGR03435 family)